MRYELSSKVKRRHCRNFGKSKFIYNGSIPGEGTATDADDLPF